MKHFTSHIFALASAAVLFSCSGKPQWHVDGRIDGADGQTMYVEASDNGRWYPLDSVTLNASGDFSFAQPAAGYPDIYRLRLGDKMLYFPIDSIETVTVVSKAAAFDRDYTLAGTDAAEQLMEIDRKVLSSVSKRGIEGMTNDSVLKRDLSNILLTNPSGIVSYYIINKKIGGTPLFNPNNRQDLRIIGAVANAFDSYRPRDPRTNYLKKIFLENHRTGLRPDTLIAKEASMIDVNLYDFHGTRQSLEKVAKDYPVILLSFTAYGSDYSPALNIELNKVFTKHHSQGFQIYQIGFDENELNWRETARNLPWISVYNAPTDGPAVLNAYNVGALPALFIIKNGEILERLTDATKIEQSVSKYM